MEITNTRTRTGPIRLVFPQWQFGFNLLKTTCNLFSAMIRLLLVYVLPYRRKIISRNLMRTFPSTSIREKEMFLTRYYYHLSDLIVEFFLIHFSSKQTVNRLIRYENPGFPGSILNEGKDVVILASHYGNWEYLLSLPDVVDCEVITAYSPVGSKRLNKILRNMRGRYGMKLIDKHEWYKHCLRHQSKRPTVYLSVTDQRPARKTQDTVSFFNQQTFVQCGGARLAERKSAATFYLDVRKISRHVYSFRFVELSDGSASVSQIMDRYFSCLETTIRRDPELWLWSHNRWQFRNML
jgi:KDO2-lipid IV(A) lauroyltransferase